MSSNSIPSDVVEYIRDVFRSCNRRVTGKLTQSPNVHEPSLDDAFIEDVAVHAGPRLMPSQWGVTIETHSLGGMRHFHSWEIADIGLVLEVRFPGGARWLKVALFQSKRLYPSVGDVRAPTMTDYQVGFGRLADPEDEALSFLNEREFKFVEESRYRALDITGEQAELIRRYERVNGLSVHYQLYNPWRVPLVQHLPLTNWSLPDEPPTLGSRIVPARLVTTDLSSAASPMLDDFASLADTPPYGWRLEDFVCDEFLTCREGTRLNSRNDERLEVLFNRRSGPISAALSIRIEAPGHFD